MNFISSFFIGFSILISFLFFSEKKEDFTKNNEAITILPFDTVRIGNQTWMAENLTINIAKSRCYFDIYFQRDDCERFGRYYTWEAAKQVAKQVPGWRLPVNKDFEELLQTTRGIFGSYDSLVEGGKSGFNAQMAGYFEPTTTASNDYYGSENGTFKNVHFSTAFWSYNQSPFHRQSYALFLGKIKKKASLGSSYDRTKLSVRLIKEE